jgi:DNA-binding transcriptional activator of the SARP family
MKKTGFSILLFIFSALWSSICSDNIDYGLYIKAFPSNDQEKTTLVLENNLPLKLGRETTMAFDLNVRKDNVFGFIFRMITDKKENIDLVFTVGENDKRYPMLVVNESVYMVMQEVTTDTWIPISITLSSIKNEISLQYGETKLSVPYDITKSKNVITSFGLCPFSGYTFMDIASVSVRDIKIFNENNVTRHWKLEKHENNLSYDLIAQVPAITTNPRWISDIYASWEKEYSKQIKENSQFAFNPNENHIYIVSPDSKEIIIFDTEKKEEDIIYVKDGIVAANAPNQLFFNPYNNQLYSYNLNENIVSHFMFENAIWTNKTKSILEHGYWNNSVSFSKTDSTLISFGGYGFYKYNNELIRLDLKQKSIKKSTLPEIPPRLSTSSVIVGNTLYIFGGRGNKSGRQELSPKNYYDFYSVNLLTEQTNKLWEIEEVDAEFLPSENMIFDEKENCFYVFTTKDGGSLLRIKKDQAGFDKVSFPIYEDLTAHYLYMNLYFSPQEKKFYALVNKIRTDKSAEVTIYSLNYPPMVLTDQDNIEQQATNEEETPLWIIICSVLALIVLVGALYSRSKSKEGNNSNKYPDGQVEKSAENNPKHKPKETEHQTYYDLSKQSICFLGGFNVIDKDGQNITGQFTPMLKYLLVLLILSTKKDEKGISGKKLMQLLWFDKNEESAKNNRNVYLSKLRSAMESIGDTEIIAQNGFWSIKLNEEIKCDYTETMRLFSVVKENDTANQTDIDRLLELLLKGVLLPNTEADWVDGFKSDFSNMTIDVLTELSRSNYHRLTDDLKLKIADTLFLHDFINEEALYLKCSIYFSSGKKGIAKTVYDNFSKEYFNLLGTKYKYSLTDVINRKNVE